MQAQLPEWANCLFDDLQKLNYQPKIIFIIVYIITYEKKFELTFSRSSTDPMIKFE
jgi:hypothetical protein